MHETLQIIKSFLVDHGIELVDQDFSGSSFVLVNGKYQPAVLCKYIIRVQATKYSPLASADHLMYVPSHQIIALNQASGYREFIDLHKEGSLEKLLKILQDKHGIKPRVIPDIGST